jgi:hypothetical protein
LPSAKAGAAAVASAAVNAAACINRDNKRIERLRGE